MSNFSVILNGAEREVKRADLSLLYDPPGLTLMLGFCTPKPVAFTKLWKFSLFATIGRCTGTVPPIWLKAEMAGGAVGLEYKVPVTTIWRTWAGSLVVLVMLVVVDSNSAKVPIWLACPV